jgi:hypothetical protein
MVSLNWGYGWSWLKLSYRIWLSTALSYITRCLGTHECGFRKRIELMFCVFPMIMSVCIVFWGHGSQRRKKIYDSLKHDKTAKNAWNPVVEVVKLKSWFYLCCDVNTENFSSRWKINTAFSWRLPNDSSPSGSLFVAGSFSHCPDTSPKVQALERRIFI